MIIYYFFKKKIKKYYDFHCPTLIDAKKIFCCKQGALIQQISQWFSAYVFEANRISTTKL